MSGGAFFANWLTFEPHSPTKKHGPSQNLNFEMGLKKLMGPEKIHIYFWEGTPRPLKQNVIDPKTWKFF